ncbi:hypothetical protein [Alloacidobacterium sp.]|uniref:hypothetical protein n=1 Tax=Alloacidobacterium sp. TaxID=2951999 RepID=UPI002D2D47B6|nr:hypothetical protein [Alloacidobacterium sp.]HYK34752.1 hypothetical protein [Alloacidobacterium sp.]
MNTPHNPANNTDKKIDAALRIFAHTQPPVNLEQRVHARLQLKPVRVKFANKLGSFFFAQRVVFASAGAALACCAIVIGSVQHSHQHTFPNTVMHVSAPGSGLGAASEAHIAPQPVAVPDGTHSRSERKATRGRATVSRDAHKPKGVTVPEATQPEKP